MQKACVSGYRPPNVAQHQSESRPAACVKVRPKATPHSPSLYRLLQGKCLYSLSRPHQILRTRYFRRRTYQKRFTTHRGRASSGIDAMVAAMTAVRRTRESRIRFFWSASQIDTTWHPHRFTTRSALRKTFSKAAFSEDGFQVWMDG